MRVRSVALLIAVSLVAGAIGGFLSARFWLQNLSWLDALSLTGVTSEPPGTPADSDPRLFSIDCDRIEALVEYTAASRQELFGSDRALTEVVGSAGVRKIGVAERPIAWQSEYRYVPEVALWRTPEASARLRQAEDAAGGLEYLFRVHVAGVRLPVSYGIWFFEGDLPMARPEPHDGTLQVINPNDPAYRYEGLLFPDESRTFEELSELIQKAVRCD